VTSSVSGHGAAVRQQVAEGINGVRRLVSVRKHPLSLLTPLLTPQKKLASNKDVATLTDCQI
jgi:hypothetical protein